MADSLKECYANRIRPSLAYDQLVKEGLLGKKSGKGFYLHKGKKPIVNPDLEKGQSDPKDQILARGIHRMRIEAYMCMREQVVTDPSHLHTALVYGIGFPAFRSSLLNTTSNGGEKL